MSLLFVLASKSRNSLYAIMSNTMKTSTSCFFPINLVGHQVDHHKGKGDVLSKILDKWSCVSPSTQEWLFQCWTIKRPELIVSWHPSFVTQSLKHLTLQASKHHSSSVSNTSQQKIVHVSWLKFVLLLVGEMLRVKMLIVLPEDPRSVPSTHVTCFTTAIKTSS